MSAPAVQAQDLRVHFPGRARPALAGVDLTVEVGEQLLVLGPSGGGKSTLLHCLTGVVPQSVDADVDGWVRVLGADPGAVPVARLALAVGWLGQDPAAGVALPSVEAEVAFTLENAGVPRAEIGPRVDRALRTVGAGHLAGRRTGRLSGGEQQRVALAAVLVGEPQVLVLDEPTSMLDPVAAAHVLDVLAREATEVPDRTTVLVEHRLAGMPWCPGRAVVVDAAGRLTEDGPTAGVLAAYRDGPGSDAAAPDAPVPDGPGSAEGGLRRGRGEGEVVVRLRGAGWSQGGRPVVHDVDLDLRRGQVTVVVGCNGSGKSSLLLGMAGLLPGTGRRDASATGLVFQRPEHQFLGRTAAADLRYGLRGPAPDLDRVVDGWLERFGLSEVADQDPFRLSGGQQRRLSVAAVAALGRPVLLLDEPTFGLDEQQTAAVARMIADRAEAGTAVALATHDLVLARRLADQVVVLGAGRVLARGGPELLDDRALLEAAGLAVGAAVPVGVGS